MKFKWTRCKGTRILMVRKTTDVTPFWEPVAWVARRKIYEDLPASWFTYRFDREIRYVLDFDTLSEAKAAAERALGLA